MPRREDLSSILLIGSGPIVIGQACEFDYSGTQAAKVLRSHGYRVILVNSNPATIMTDPEFADATYIEPITPEMVEAIIAKERPDALLATLGGQTALNVATRLARSGVLQRYGVEMIGAGLEAIERAEDRGLFKTTMEEAGLAVPRAGYARSMQEAVRISEDIGFPIMIRPSFILGGGGTGIAEDQEAFIELARRGLVASPVGEILVEESVAGWKEFELEVMRDRRDNAVIVCSIENLDPMGVHTGDSITVAPIQTLSDREYQEMRAEAIEVLRVIGVETGGSNVQFAVDPATGRRLVIEMNPRVSRSSALASKATGFPIAKIAALLAVGFTLDEIPNDITGATPASFEPALDYTVVKIPRFDFGKFPSAPKQLGTAMRSVGEAMAIGRTFREALQKAVRSLENGHTGIGADRTEQAFASMETDDLLDSIEVATPTRLFEVAEALRRGASVDEVAARAGFDPWFVDEMAEIVAMRLDLERSGFSELGLRRAKRTGFSDAQLGYLWDLPAEEVRARRMAAGITTTFKTVDTCAAEFEAHTPYMYGTFEDEDEVTAATKPRVVVLGSGPNRIGQGIEFDYCCVHAAFALREAGYETVMVNCNPETVSTDYDTADRLYFEPLTSEDVLAIVEAEQPEAVIVQLGGQTPLNLARKLQEAGVRIAGTSPDSIDMAEDREQFSDVCRRLGIKQPPHGIAMGRIEATEVVDQVGLPVVVRPSYVLGGRKMRVIYTYDELSDYLDDLYGDVGEQEITEVPLLIDRFLESATEVDVDALFDGAELLVGGVMEHVEEAGVHSGDSACVVPPPTLSEAAHKSILVHTADLARELGVLGLINIQFAVKGDDVFVLEANPRASRTIPFISKASGIPLAKLAARVMMGASLEELRAAGLLVEPAEMPFTAVKEAVLPWDRFPEQDSILGPEMRATGEVMGIGADAGVAYAKALLAAGHKLPSEGTVFLSLADRDKPLGLAVAQAFQMLGFSLIATRGTARFLAHHAIEAEVVNKVGEGPDDTRQRIDSGQIHLIVNTPRGGRARNDGMIIRRSARAQGVPCVTTIQGALSVARSLRSGDDLVNTPRSLQEWHEKE
ncbi:MAG: carbamoyl-phosphate synthase large subunit [Acidimicrobiia bacterium]|nr:carbamoyl-phosphate synthase large subunit [Acidimicrobiia bacterium]